MTSMKRVCSDSLSTEKAEKSLKMTPETMDIIASSGLVPANYISQAKDARRTRENKIRHLFEQRKLPHDGWSDSDILSLLDEMSHMDSNNFPGNCGVGEREARVYSGLVKQRHYSLGHGVGRSGDLAEIQPKAAGSSAIAKLTNSLVLDLIRQLGVRSCHECLVVPMATGMTIALCLLTVKKIRPPTAKYVLWSRIDQKSCFKSIICAGFEPVVIQLIPKGDELQTDLQSLEAKIQELGSENIAAIMTTTSCFAPRGADDLVHVQKLCTIHNIPHVINNAYGVQSSKCLHLIEEVGRISNPDHFTVFVQSTDKNFMVPVGGAIVGGFCQSKWVKMIGQNYPGRASSSPTLDLFITLLSMGLNGYKKLLQERKENYTLLKEEMMKVAERYGETVLENKNNQISIAMTLSTVLAGENDNTKAVSEVGSMLFTRGVSGTRVITEKEEKTIEGYLFKGWGSHFDDTRIPYLTAAAAIGMGKDDITMFIKRLEKVLSSRSNPINQQ